MAYNMYLSQETETGTLVLKLPELPEEWKVKLAVNNTKYNVLALGDIIVPGSRGLKSFSIASYFEAADAQTARAIVEQMIDNQVPVRVIVNRMTGSSFDYDENILAVIDEFEPSEVGGEVGDLYFTIKCTEYREYKAKVIGSA